MGLPQYLKRKLDAMWEGEAGSYGVLLWHLYYAGKWARVREHDHTGLNAILRKYLKVRYRSFMEDKPSSSFAVDPIPLELDLVDTTRFVGVWKDKDGTLQWEGEPTKVQRRYLSKYEKRRTARIEREMELVRQRDKRLAYRHKVYQSRTFPPTVSVLIWERDDYTCKCCNRNQEELRRIGRWLTVDHIQEWEDGGLTTMGNGQTLCNVCNTAKHHAKWYFAPTKDMRSA